MPTRPPKVELPLELLPVQPGRLGGQVPPGYRQHPQGPGGHLLPLVQDVPPPPGGQGQAPGQGGAPGQQHVGGPLHQHPHPATGQGVEGVLIRLRVESKGTSPTRGMSWSSSC